MASLARCLRWLRAPRTPRLPAVGCRPRLRVGCRQLCVHAQAEAKGKGGATAAADALVPASATEITGLEALGRHELLVILEQVSRAGVRNPKVWRAYADRALAEVRSCSIEELCTLLRAFCRARYVKKALLNAVGRRLKKEGRSLPPRMLAQAASDLRNLGHLDGPLLLSLVGSLESRISECQAFDLALLLAAFAKASVRDESRLAVIGQAFLARRAEHVPASVMMAFNALAQLDSEGGGAAGTLAAGPLRRCVSSVSRSELTIMAFSLVMADLPEGGLLSFVLERLAKQCNELGPKEVHALNVVDHCVRLPVALRPTMRDSLVGDPVAMQRCATALEQIRDATDGLDIPYAVMSSKLQRHLERFFKKLRVPHKAEGAVGPYMLDYVLPQRVAVEVDGYKHFYAFTQRLTAKSQLKLRVLKALGWNVVSIPHFDWLKKREDDRLIYLEDQIVASTGGSMDAVRKAEDDTHEFTRPRGKYKDPFSGGAPARGRQGQRR